MKFLRTTELSPDYQIYEIDHPAFKARIARHGAQIIEWQPAGFESVVYCSPEAVFREGKAIRGGIPICWPWFNAHPTDPEKPSHGIARTRFWKLEDASESETQVRLTFSLEDDEETRRLWPFQFRFEIEITLGAELEIRLTTVNRGETIMPASGAIHAYLSTSDITKSTITGIENRFFCRARDRYIQRYDPSGIPLIIDDEIDRIYCETDRVILNNQDQKITVDKAGAPSTVVWNPWIEKAAALADLPDDGYKNFVCIEPVIPNPFAVEIQPGGKLEIGMRLGVSR